MESYLVPDVTRLVRGVVREPTLLPMGFDKLSPHCSDQSRALSLSKRPPRINVLVRNIS